MVAWVTAYMSRSIVDVARLTSKSPPVLPCMMFSAMPVRLYCGNRADITDSRESCGRAAPMRVTVSDGSFLLNRA